jgi:hypothetical protein
MKLTTFQAAVQTAAISSRSFSLVLGSALSALIIGTVYAADNAKRDEHQGKSSEHRDEPHRDRDRDRDRHGYVNGNYYAQPVYAPPVIAVPVQSPGINLFVPLDIHVR